MVVGITEEPQAAKVGFPSLPPTVLDGDNMLKPHFPQPLGGGLQICLSRNTSPGGFSAKARNPLLVHVKKGPALQTCCARPPSLSPGAVKLLVPIGLQGVVTRFRLGLPGPTATHPSGPLVLFGA